MPTDPGAEKRFEDLAARLDYPMFIVTAATETQRAGCLVGFAVQCSISPPRFMVMISKENFTHGVAADASHLAVHVVPKERRDLAELFGGETGDEIDKFGRCEWTEGPGRLPVLDDCLDAFVGDVLGSFDVGDHTAFLVAPVEVRSEGSSFLPFSAVRDLDPGHDA